MSVTAVPFPPPLRPSGRRGVRAGLLMAAVMMLTACPGPSVPPVSMAAPMVVPPASPARVKAAPTPPRSPVAAARHDPDAPPALVGISQQQARALLGAPAATAEEASAIVWHYGGVGCELRLFFFMDVTAHDFRTLSYETTETGPDRGDSARCLARLAARKGDDRHD